MEVIELDLSCLKKDKAKRLQELDDMVVNLDSTVDNQLFTEQMQLAKELVFELQKSNQKFIFAIKEWDENRISFICKPATFTSLDGEFGYSNEYHVLDIGLDGDFIYEEFQEMIENNIKSKKIRRDR